ncbi:MAG: MFS transporter [Comamonas sp.]
MTNRQLGAVIGELPDWKPHERPAIPGTPATPDFPTPVRIGYGLAGLLLGLTGGFGTALVGVNLPAIQGQLGLDTVQGTWLSCIYVMFNVSMNLLLIKYRQQFGLTSFTKVFMLIYAAAVVGMLLIDSFAGALVMRAIGGVAGAALGALAVMYMSQSMPARMRLQTIVLGIGASQLAMPLAWMLSPSLLEFGDWQSLYALEAGLALASLAAVYAFPMPHGIRVLAFERKDFISFALLAPGFALLVAVVAQGRNHWWLDAGWLGWALAGAIALIGAGLAFEHRRSKPLLDTHWLFSLGFMNFAFSLLLVRMLLSEQPFGATGLLMTLGFGTDQLRELYGVALAATVAGVLVSAFSLLISPKLIVAQLLLSLILIIVGSLMDARATAATHPADLYVSQALLSFSGAMFMGAAVIIGIGHLMKRGLDSVITFAVVFGVTQILGGQLGAAILSTFQAMRVQHHLGYLAEGLAIGDASAAAAVQAYGGIAGLAQQASQQASILAFNDVFLLIAAFAALQLAINLADMALQALRSRKASPQPAAGGDRAAGAASI